MTEAWGDREITLRYESGKGTGDQVKEWGRRQIDKYVRLEYAVRNLCKGEKNKVK